MFLCSEKQLSNRPIRDCFSSSAALPTAEGAVGARDGLLPPSLVPLDSPGNDTTTSPPPSWGNSPSFLSFFASFLSRKICIIT